MSPSGPVPPDRLERGVQVLRSWGLEVAVAPHAVATHPELDYLAGTDAQRAGDFQAAWCDPRIDAILCARGGYGAFRMVDLLDFEAMGRARPKILAGYSDVTALHQAIGTRLGVVTLHAPMIGAEPFTSDEPTRAMLRRMLFEPELVRTITATGARALIGGRAGGITMGGCLSLLASGVGGPTGPRSAAGSILVIEDVDEKRYQIDRMLTELLRSGWLTGVAAVVAGSWHDCEDGVDEVLIDRLSPLGVPVLTDVGFGHGSRSATVPLGVPAVVEDAGIHLYEPALA
ncbi:S66 peptidase family protein [Pseudactinotalea sp. Z1739]|uniref:S66 peptidase family protein n=1 Tax=Pseudactinotalea sp. Z1739 TaxID=3413028 RepID=UPI003C7A2050